MENHDLYYEVSGMKQKIDALKSTVDEVKAIVRPDEELWDNSDMIQNWKVSARTLADWRANGIISYVQVGNKIWYTREARELFLTMYYHKVKEERK